MNRVLKESGPVSLDGVTNELKNPTTDEKYESPSPFEEEQGPRNRDHGNPERVAKLIQRVLMLRFVVFNQQIAHGHPSPKHL
jgi:hypothetical protein